MPWVKEDDCVACGICIEECPAGAISMVEDHARIDMDECIRCGTCHEVCPEGAVRHDGEKSGERIEQNIQWVMDLMEHFETEDEKNGLLNRMKKHFTNEINIAEQTLGRLESLEP
jgi:ferredoxin